MKSSDEYFDSDSRLNDIVELIEESTIESSPSTSASQLYLTWPIEHEVLAPQVADWPAIMPQAEVVGRQPETETATWSGATRSDVSVAMSDYAEGLSAVGVANCPATWKDSDSFLNDFVEYIEESTIASCPSTSASQLYLTWPIEHEVLAPQVADWPAIMPQAEVVSRQPETETATWSGGTRSDVSVAMSDYAEGLSAVGVANCPATWKVVFETKPAAPLKSVCLLPPGPFDVNRLISPVPSFSTPPATHSPGDDVVMATQGLLLHPCDKPDDSLDVFDLDTDLDSGHLLDIRSTTPLLTLLTLNPSEVWPITPSGPSHTIPAQNIIQLSSPALPINVALRGATSVVESSLEDVGSGRNRISSRCISDSEVQLSGDTSTLLTSQGSKRQGKGTTARGAPGIRGRSTSEAGVPRTTNTEDAEVDDSRLNRRRALNRKAAKVYRDKKREMSASLVKEQNDLLSSNAAFASRYIQLQQGKHDLKTVLERHLTTCTRLTSSPLTSSTLTSSDLTSSLAHHTQTSDEPMTSSDLFDPLSSSDLQ